MRFQLFLDDVRWHKCLPLRLFLLVAFSLVFSALYAEPWTDVSGRHSIDASFVSMQDGVVLLRRGDGRQVRIPLEKLDAKSRERAREVSSTSGGPPKNLVLAELKNANSLEALAKNLRSARHSLKLYESYLSQADLEPGDRDKAGKRLKLWKERANEGRLRWGKHWFTIEEIRKGLLEEERLLKEAHRLIEVGNDVMARERFEGASKSNPEGVRADFYLGILHSLLGRHAKSAEENFSLCVNRLKQNPDRLFGTRRSNLVAALNNRAICRVRRGKHLKALRDWNEAIKMAPMTPELVQNLGYYVRLASVVPGWKVARTASRKVADQYAKLTVANQTAEFQEHTGWLFIPYVDAPKLPDFEDMQFVGSGVKEEGEFLDLEAGAENDFRVVGWATGVAVDQQHLLMSRRSIGRSQGLWVRKDGRLRRDLPGKVVAVSGSYDLALVRFQGLGAHVIPFSTEESTRATEIRILGFAEPGILEEGPKVSKGTIIDLDSTFVPLGKQYLTTEVTRTNLVATEQHAAGETVSILKTIAVPIGKEYVTTLIHDAFLNSGSLGAPIFNLQGRIMGIDLDGARRRKTVGGDNHALNHTEIRAFLDSTSMEFPAIDENPTGMIVDIDGYVRAAADSAVFQVAIVGRVARLSWTNRIGEIRGIQTKAGWNAFEDSWCMRCNGKGEIACPEHGCIQGWVSHRVAYIDGYLPGTGTPIRKQKWVKERCRSCNTTGKLTCPHCRGKLQEPSL